MHSKRASRRDINSNRAYKLGCFFVVTKIACSPYHVNWFVYSPSLITPKISVWLHSHELISFLYNFLASPLLRLLSPVTTCWGHKVEHTKTRSRRSAADSTMRQTTRSLPDPAAAPPSQDLCASLPLRRACDMKCTLQKDELYYLVFASFVLRIISTRQPVNCICFSYLCKVY